MEVVDTTKLKLTIEDIVDEEMDYINQIWRAQ
jgi:hypothetical protein